MATSMQPNPEELNTPPVELLNHPDVHKDYLGNVLIQLLNKDRKILWSAHTGKPTNGLTPRGKDFLATLPAGVALSEDIPEEITPMPSAGDGDDGDGDEDSDIADTPLALTEKKEIKVGPPPAYAYLNNRYAKVVVAGREYSRDEFLTSKLKENDISEVRIPKSCKNCNRSWQLRTIYKITPPVVYPSPESRGLVLGVDYDVDLDDPNPQPIKEAIGVEFDPCCDKTEILYTSLMFEVKPKAVKVPKVKKGKAGKTAEPKQTKPDVVADVAMPWQQQIQAIFEPGDFLHIRLIHGTETYLKNGEEIPKSAEYWYSYEDIVDPGSLAALESFQTQGWNIYVCVAVFDQAKIGAIRKANTALSGHAAKQPRRVNDNIAVVEGKHVIRAAAIECDENGEQSFKKIYEAVDAEVIPAPTLAIRSSTPATAAGFQKYHFWWAVKGFTLEQQAALNEALQVMFGGDSKAKDTVRVLRLAGFINQSKKYPHKPVATIIRSSTAGRYALDQFKLPLTVKTSETRPKASSDYIEFVSSQIEENADKADFELGDVESWKGTGFKWVQSECPNADAHTTGRAGSCVMVMPSGARDFTCLHTNCSHLDWNWFKDHLNGLANQTLDWSNAAFSGEISDKSTVLCGEDRHVASQPTEPQVEAPAPAGQDPQPASASASAPAGAASSAAVIDSDDVFEYKSSQIPAFDPSVMKGSVFDEFVHIVTDGTTLQPQFAYQIGRVFLCALLAGRVKFDVLAGVPPLRRLVMIGETGSGKGESYRRAESVITYGGTRCNEVIKITHSVDSGAGLKDMFWDEPMGLPVLVYIDEITTLGHKASDKKNPEILDAMGELADSTSISRTLAKRARSKEKASKTLNDAYLFSVACAPDGLTFMCATAGRKTAGFNDRQIPVFGVAVEPGELPEIPMSAIADWWLKVYQLLEMVGTKKKPGTVVMSPEAKALIEDFWRQQSAATRRKVRYKKYLQLDAYLNAISRSRMTVLVEDVEDAIKDCKRELMTRLVCFQEEVNDRVGFYFFALKRLTAEMRSKSRTMPLNADIFDYALSESDFERESRAFGNNEPEQFQRAWKAWAPRHLEKLPAKTVWNGRQVVRYIPARSERD